MNSATWAFSATSIETDNILRTEYLPHCGRPSLAHCNLHRGGSRAPYAQGYRRLDADTERSAVLTPAWYFPARAAVKVGTHAYPRYRIDSHQRN